MEKETKYLNRWAYAIIGLILMFFAGMVHAWTIFQNPIKLQYPEWNAATLGITFTIVMLCYFFGGMIAGKLQKTMKPGRVLQFCGLAIVIGMVISSFASSIFVLYIGFGVFVGLGSGAAYNVLLSSVGRWFPDKQGLISGILMMGIGIGTFLSGKVFAAVTAFDGGPQWRTSFMIFGIVVFVIYLIGGFLLKKPADGWKPEGMAGSQAMVSYEDIDTKTMIKRPAFWIFFAWAVLLSISGLMFTSQAAQMAAEAAPAMEAGAIATVVGFFNIANSIGRIIYGILFDKIGRMWDMLLGGVVFIIGAILMMLALSGQSEGLMIIALLVVGAGYGVVQPMNSAVISRFFGLTYYPSNFALVVMVLIFASFGSTISGALYDGTGSYYATCILVLVLVVIASIIQFFIRPPKKK